jgi:DNA-binding MarR family transcriptional regulator
MPQATPPPAPGANDHAARPGDAARPSHGAGPSHASRPGHAAGTGGTAGPGGDCVDHIQEAWERERPGTPAGSIGVITRIWRIGKLLADERRRTLARLGIDAATLDLLSTLRRAGRPYRLTAGTLAELSLVSAGAVSQRLARAEREGLVHRERSPADGRLSYVTLTDAGHALIERSVDELLGHEEALLTGLAAGQREDLTVLLRVLLRSLSSL